ncbi:MAG: hypothetical protein Q8M03_04685 [Legionella sp.]|nr:hypothetical protein [Legionella sp.]
MPSHIVLVEDTKSNVVAFERQLSRVIENYELENRINGMDAIQYITENKEKIDLVVLDGNLAPALIEDKPCHGPDVAAAILKLNLRIAVWTTDEKMEARFIKLFTEKGFTNYHVIGRKPCFKEDMEKLMEFAQITPRALSELSEVCASVGPRLL